MKSQNMKKLIIFVSIILAIVSVSSLLIAHGWKAPKEAAKLNNPLETNSQIIQAGRELYVDFCSSCHGINAEGGGNLDLGLSMVPPDLRQRLKDHSDGGFFWKIQNGREEMPSFKEDLQDDEIWEIISFLKTLIEK